MNWLVKEEPRSYSFARLVKDGGTRWSGVRNPLAQRHLRAIRAGHVGKNTAAATAKFGRPSGKSHVEKRRQDFVRWGWLWPGRDAELTEDGRRWLAELAPSGRAPANFAAPAT